jgi:cellulose synthase operon protein B
MKIWPRALPFAVAALLAGRAAAAAETGDPAGMPRPADGTSRIQVLRLSKLAYNKTAVHLRSTDGSAEFDFGTRADDIVTSATLRLRYTFSPALIAGLSHLKVMINGELVAVLPFPKEEAGRLLDRDIEIDPRYITDLNKLRLEFVGHYTDQCEEPFHSSLWVDISGASELRLALRQVRVRDDLARLPAPLFDERSVERLDLPVVFSARPSLPTLRAAGIAASWFGKLASWRGARFSAQLNRLPPGHALVFATNAERPAFLAAAPPYAGPGLAITTNPADGVSKLLLITGRDGRDLNAAVLSLALGTAALSGERVAVQPTDQPPPRAAYDAPNWVRLDRPMRFGELVRTQQQLQAVGHVAEPVRLNLRVAPDLYVWGSGGVPVDYTFRYTPPIRASESRLTMSMNDELVQAVNLRSSGQNHELARAVLPILDDGRVADRRQVRIPAYQLRAHNQLDYSFAFTYQKEGACRDALVENVRAMIDPDSTIDFSGFPHYAQMPHLGYFAAAGFPFTKYADLSQTTVVLPLMPAAADIAAMLTLLGRMGESTGYPATRVILAGPHDRDALEDHDLLLIGTGLDQPLLASWGAALPAAVSGGARRISTPARPGNVIYDGFGAGAGPDIRIAAQALVQGDGPLGALLGFESPLTPRRSVVVLTGVRPDDYGQVLDALDDGAKVAAMYGSAVFVRGDKVDSVLAGDTYVLGALPLWRRIRDALAERPYPAAAGGGALLALAGWLAHRVRRRPRAPTGAGK